MDGEKEEHILAILALFSKLHTILQTKNLVYLHSLLLVLSPQWEV